MTVTRRNRPMEITDAPERRSIPMDRIALRNGDGDSDELTLVGYASTFEPYEMYGGPENLGWIEEIDRHAFDKTLREKPDLHLLINHAGMPLARTKSGTLKLSVDDNGLKVEAKLDRNDPDVQRLEIKMRRGDMDEMSFAFRVKAQEWSAAPGFEEIDEMSYRRITEVSLHKGDVSIVNFGANPTTHAELLSLDEALKRIIEADEEELADVRSADESLLHEARKRLYADILKKFDGDILPVNQIREMEGLPPVGELVINLRRKERDDCPLGCVVIDVDKRDEDGRYLVELSEAEIAHIRAGLELSDAVAGEEVQGIAEALASNFDQIDASIDEAKQILSEAEEDLAEERKRTSVREALAAQGIVTRDDERPLTLAEALAIVEGRAKEVRRVTTNTADEDESA